ncbi:hypothetical protein NDU88_002966 [Pleurodeles waltl]|uniref:Uncharacterized protein n=1 Tax=Pleurodeles waltl TaxID=8319 RepID=A0AAV7WRQ8_PLEWA|nr:hypothetical protein NDU88_002966 [Pleurodeles waltl]
MGAQEEWQLETVKRRIRGRWYQLLLDKVNLEVPEECPLPINLVTSAGQETWKHGSTFRGEQADCGSAITVDLSTVETDHRTHVGNGKEKKKRPTQE